MNNTIILFVLGVMIVPQIIMCNLKEKDVIFIRSLTILNVSFPNSVLLIFSILVACIHLLIC